MVSKRGLVVSVVQDEGAVEILRVEVADTEKSEATCQQPFCSLKDWHLSGVEF